MTRRGHLTAAALLVAVAVAGCGSTGVRLTRSDQHGPVTVAPTDSTEPTESTEPTDPPSPPGSFVDGGDGLPAIAAVQWGRCDTHPAPWQCGTISVPLDYSDPEGDQIDIALTRLPATEPDKRIGSLVLNPGGPGGSGLELAYGEGPNFPREITDVFDLVGFDPRGVGSSTAVACPLSYDPGFDDYTPCIKASGPLLPYLGTPNVARDLEMIRRAIGDAQLTYLGFSYGTALGAVYADMFPSKIRALVLDGAIDPQAGESNVEGGGGYDFYAEQDFDGTVREFQDLCDASAVCPAGPHTRQLMNRVESKIEDLPTPLFDGGALDSLVRSDFDDIVQAAMYNVASWPVLATALADADAGDASTLTAMYSWLQFGYPADMEHEANYDFANIAIRCADFSDRGSGSFSCDGFPESADPLPLITEIKSPLPVLVVGTDGDPATPGRYAAQLADALGDAVSIDWQGAGHTAYLTSKCITDLVGRYLIDRTVPTDGQTCPFVVGAKTLTERADVIFGPIEPARARAELVPVLVAQGNDEARATCIADGIIARGDQRLVVHQILGVDSADLVSLRGLIERRCR